MAMPEWAEKLNKMVGKRVQQLRHRANPTPLTQAQLAQRTKAALSRSSIASLERGLQGISLVQLYVLAQALEVEPSELLPARSDVLPREPRRVEELLKSSRPEVARFLSKVREEAAPTKEKKHA